MSYLLVIIVLLAVSMIVLLSKYRSKVSEINRELSETKNESEKIKKALTNLDEVDEINQVYTFKYFHHLVEREIERAERYDNKFSLLFVEVKNLSEFKEDQQTIKFKNILDIIKSNIRLVDICFQNEVSFSFVVVLAECDPGQAKKIAARTYNSIKKLNNDDKQLDVVMGIVAYPVDGTLRRNLIDKSKVCIEESSKLEGDKIVVYSEFSAGN